MLQVIDPVALSTADVPVMVAPPRPIPALKVRRAPSAAQLEQIAAVREDARPLIRSLLTANLRPSGFPERRLEQRYACPRLFVLLPIDPDTLQGVAAAMTVAGKQISESGISFFHPQPLAFRWIEATVEHNGVDIRFLVDLDWCRFTRQGWYESGGRILGALNRRQGA